MAGALMRSRKFTRSIHSESRSSGSDARFAWTGRVLNVVLGAFGGTGAMLYFLEKSVKAISAEPLDPPHYPWGIYTNPLSFYDKRSLRRGWQVYKTVCHSCHSIRYIPFYKMVNVFLTEKEAMETAAEFEVEDGPDSDGNMFMRPGKITDLIPMPFPNEEAAKAANSGATPPDLTLQVDAKHNGVNYVFSLLTGYWDPPAGINLEPWQSYNPYFYGNVISMPQVLQDGMLEFEDGTPATVSQMAKDVVHFLCWTSKPQWEAKNFECLTMLGAVLISLICTILTTKRTWSFIRSRQIHLIPKQKW